MTDSRPGAWDSANTIAHFEQYGVETAIPPLVPYLSAGAQVLDVGCGPGTITIDVARRIGTGAAVGVDSAPAMIERAKQMATDTGVGNVSFRCSDALSLGFPDNTFDVTYCSNLISHLRDPESAIREQIRVTKPIRRHS
jgi:ubiquinone/menaquinone biosynthesis C-methylase UbiE